MFLLIIFEKLSIINFKFEINFGNNSFVGVTIFIILFANDNKSSFNFNFTSPFIVFKLFKVIFKLNLNDDLLYFANNIINIVTPTNELFPKLISNLKTIIDNFSNISLLLKETSEIFFKLTNEAQNIIQNEEVLKTYSKLNAIFNYWNDSLI